MIMVRLVTNFGLKLTLLAMDFVLEILLIHIALA